MTRLLLAALALALALAACTPAQQAKVDQVVIAGQSICRVATATGPGLVALADLSGAPVSVTGKTAAAVAASCALVNGIPVAPPDAPVTIPVVRVPVV